MYLYICLSTCTLNTIKPPYTNPVSAIRTPVNLFSLLPTRKIPPMYVGYECHTTTAVMALCHRQTSRNGISPSR